MKFERKDEGEFQPFTITIETEDEAKLVWHALNADVADWKAYAGKYQDELLDLAKRADVNAMFEEYDTFLEEEFEMEMTFDDEDSY